MIRIIIISIIVIVIKINQNLPSSIPHVSEGGLQHQQKVLLVVSYLATWAMTMLVGGLLIKMGTYKLEMGR